MSKVIKKKSSTSTYQDSDIAVKLLQKHRTPILIIHIRQEFQGSQHFQPLCHIQFQHLLNSGSQEPTTPSTALQMSYWSAWAALVCIKKNVDMGIHLADNRVVDIELRVQGKCWDISGQTAVFELVTIVVGYQMSRVALLLHQNHWIQNLKPMR